MTSKPPEPLETLSADTQRGWHAFVTLYEPLRSDLYRYCRYLTRSPWDAEDLAQDSLARAFATLGRMGHAPPNPKAWLFRVASNLWIDQVRRQAHAGAQTAELSAAQAATTSGDPQAMREAAGTLVARLAPQERAALVLKDVLGFSLEETAEALSTSQGAIKAALHRGRGKLVEPEVEETRKAAPQVLTAFCEAFNQQDIPRLMALLLDHASVEVVGTSVEGPQDGTILRGMLFGSQRMARADELGGMEARFMLGVQPTPARAQLAFYRGAPLILSWYAHADGEMVRAVTRAEITDGRISRLKNYFFTPDFIRDVCDELGVPHRSNGHRYWLPNRRPRGA